MRILADENFPLASVRSLRAGGHDVAAIPEDEPGTKDEVILARAVREERILRTFDRDFGELIFKKRLPSPPGIVHFRLDPSHPLEPYEILIGIEESTLLKKYTVLRRGRIRRRPLP